MKNLLTKETMGLQGEISVTLKDKYGNAKKLWSENFLGKFLRQNFGRDLQGIFFLGNWTKNLVIKNLITNAGKAESAGLLNGVTTGAFTYVAIGIGVVAAGVTDTALGSEITTGGGSRFNSVASRVTTTVTNDTMQLVATWTFTLSFAVTESGVLDAAAAGQMLARQVFAAQNVASGDSLEYSWKISVS